MTGSLTVAPVAQMANCEKRMSVDKSESALHQNIAGKGQNAYYFAHNRHFEIPDDAKIVSGPGLVTGGPPQLLTQGERVLAEEDRIVYIKDYSWADCGAKVKVYIPCDGLAAAAGEEGGVESLARASFDKMGLVLDIAVAPMQRLKLEKLNAEVKPDDCKVKVEVAKSRVTLILAKKRETSWYSLLK